MGGRRPRQALELCDRALALFSGELLPGAGDARWVAPVPRCGWRRPGCGLIEERLAARADLGSSGELVAELEDLVAAHPLRERLWALLVTDLYRAGRQADALAACARVRRLLADELGIDPGPAAAAPRGAGAAPGPGAERVAPRAAGGGPASEWPSREPVRGNLPTAPGSLVGRDAAPRAPGGTLLAQEPPRHA